MGLVTRQVLARAKETTAEVVNQVPLLMVAVVVVEQAQWAPMELPLRVAQAETELPLLSLALPLLMLVAGVVEAIRRHLALEARVVEAQVGFSRQLTLSLALLTRAAVEAEALQRLPPVQQAVQES